MSDNILRSEMCKSCAHTKVCMKDKNLCGDVFVMGHPCFFDNDELYRRYKELEAAGFPCEDYLQEQKHGKWVDTEPHLKDWQQRKNGMAYYCSVCGHRAGKNKHRTYKHCPWCGAKMDGDSDV